MPQRAIIYHASCIDGFTAAWCCWRRWGDDAEYIPAHYGDDPPDVTGKDVVIVDFSYPRQALLEMRDRAASLVVMDHHKTAAADLDGLEFATFDMDRSGAGLAWDELIGSIRPRLVDYVEDRDLWRWQLRKSREINAYIATCERDFMEWRRLDKALALDPDYVADMGKIALRVTEQYVESQKRRATRGSICGYSVPIINTTFAVSELVGALAEGEPFAAGWFQRDDGMFVYSLRSRDGGVDVSEVARQLCGGGHRNAAGFMSPTLLTGGVE